jgi:hypothetical protein
VSHKKIVIALIEKNTTEQEYDAAVRVCKDIFLKKNHDYGTSWRILRPSSITDQLFIKAKRIKTLEEKTAKVSEGKISEYIAIVNYAVIGIIQLELAATENFEMSTNVLEKNYDSIIAETRELMFLKNHDYGEAWRDMRISSLTDLILMKLLRIKQIENNKGNTLISEGVKANYQDILNYAIFALIRLNS